MYLNFEGEENFCKDVRWVEIQSKGKIQLWFYPVCSFQWQILSGVDIISNMWVTEIIILTMWRRVYRGIYLELDTSPRRWLQYSRKKDTTGLNYLGGRDDGGEEMNLREMIRDQWKDLLSVECSALWGTNESRNHFWFLPWVTG